MAPAPQEAEVWDCHARHGYNLNIMDVLDTIVWLTGIGNSHNVVSRANLTFWHLRRTASAKFL